MIDEFVVHYSLGGSSDEIPQQPADDDRTAVVTADDVTLHVGDVAYSHYSMRKGVIEEPDDQGWFNLRYDDGGRDLLNGERICSLAFAKRRGFPGV